MDRERILRGLAMVCTIALAGDLSHADVLLRLKSRVAEAPAAVRVMLPREIADRPEGPNRVHQITIMTSGKGAATGILVPDPEPLDTRAGHEATLFLASGSLPAGTLRAQLAASFAATTLSDAASVPIRGASLRFAPGQSGGLPTAITFTGSGRTLDTFVWNDRLYEPSRAGWLLRNDPDPVVRIIWKSPELTIVRTSARYCNDAGQPAPGNAKATYDWYLSPNSEATLIQAFVRQDQPLRWSEIHHLELNFPDDSFGAWAGGNPERSGLFSAQRKGWDTADWGCLVQGSEAIGIMGQRVRFYDGRGEYGTYIHGTWAEWTGRRTRMGAWMWIGSAADAAKRVMASAAVRRSGRAVFTTRTTAERIARLQQRTRPVRTQWLATVAERLEDAGEPALAQAILAAAERPGAPLPTGWYTTRAGSLWMALRRVTDGIALASLYDAAKRTELAAGSQPPLFRVQFATEPGSEPPAVEANSGWANIAVRPSASNLVIEWSHHRDPRHSGVKVTATAQLDQRKSAIRWRMAVVPGAGASGIRSVAFPQIAVEAMAADARALYPVGPGEEASLAATDTINRSALYPNGWCTIPLMAIYSPRSGTGLYVACHDPFAASKNVIQKRAGADQPVLLAFDVPAPDMDKPGVRFEWPGQTVWQTLHGDWFDAAMIYREWASAEAAWWPKRSESGRADTPQWMRELCAWAQTGGAPADCVEPVKQMQRTLGVPIGFHWYNWHQIPFDNDYPHYFPTKSGVAEAVADLQANSVHVMPYINGRLWDTRDRGTADYQFTSRARPAATKAADGTPVTESYGSVESDGSPVRLAVMCPTTDLWRSVVRETVLRIMTEVGAHGVYIDQIAAAAPVLCMDATHGHPLGGGHWWTRDGYWPLLAEIRKQMPAGHMITTECAAEPYAHQLDANLTWDWQGNGMVPVLPAIYGGRVQYFGRNYAAGATTRDLALCMKMGQQLVFGEQIGWLSPGIAQEPVAGAFLRQVVRIRHRNVRFFSSGEMARPPAIAGDIPSVRADWAWYGETWVTTSAVLTGAWIRPRHRELLLIFANVSDKPVRGRFRWDPTRYGLPASRPTVVKTVGLGDPGARQALPRGSQHVIALEPRTVETWIVRW